MSASQGSVVALYLLTQDNDLAENFVTGLDAEGLDNKVQRASAGASLIAAIDARKRITPYIIVLDMRSPNADAHRFLADAQRKYSATPPVVVIVADRDDETASLDAFANMIAGRISSNEPAKDFVKLTEVTLSKSWSIEPVGTTSTKTID